MNTESPKILVVAAHAADYVWRCGGTIAKYAARGSEIRVIALAEGVRGEANDYWKTEGANDETCKDLKISDSQKAADILGVKELHLYHLPDYPLTVDNATVERLAHEIREFAPDVILTHADFDQFNPDHNETALAVRKANACASGSGFHDPNPVKARQIPTFGFEPQMTEISGFNPVVYVDITDSFETKLEAMHASVTQPNMYKAYVRKAESRGSEVRSRGSRSKCKYAEAFTVYMPIAASGDLVW